MKMQRKWRRAWLRGKRSYYREWWLGQKRQQALANSQHQQKRSKLSRHKRLASWVSPAAAAVVMLATVSLGLSVANAQANNITTTGKTATTVTAVNANVTDITTTTLAGINALNSFAQFNVGGGNTVNLRLPSNATNLINLVSGGQSQINGILNSIKDNKIGGNVFFLNPNGLVVGASGSVNVGSLTVYTPTTDFMNRFLDNDMRDYSITATTGGTLPISPSGLISIEGTINGINSVTFGSGTSNDSYTSGTVVKSTGGINVGASFNTSASQSNLFDSVVNVNAWGAAPVTVVTTGQAGNVGVSGSFTNQGQITSGGANALTLSVGKDLIITNSGSIKTAVDLGVSAETVAISGQVQTGGGNFTIAAEDSITVSDGAIISTRQVAVSTPLTDHEKSGVLSTGNSGDIDMKVKHETYVGTATIDIGGNAKLVSFANNGKTGGDISVVASSEDRLFAWAMTGPDAKVTISNSLLKGKNITIEAVAKNNADNNQTADESADVNDPDNTASLEKLGEEKSESNTGDSLVNTLANLRVIAAVTNVHAKAEVIIDDKAKLQADQHVKISTEAASAVTSKLYSALGGAGVAFSDAQALTSVNSGAEITAGGTVDVLADTENTIDIVTKTALANGMPLNVMVSYAQMTSNASAVVGAGATISAGGDLSVKADSVKEMAVEASATDKRGYFSAGVAISNSDVNANAQIAGKVKAGNVIVDAKVDTKENTTWSDAVVGDGEPGSGSQLAADWMVNGVGGWMKKTLELGKTPKAIPPTVGVTGAIAVTLSEDTATAKITSTGTTTLANGNLVNNAVQSLGKISVAADLTEVMQSGAIAEEKQREENSVLNQPTGANKKVAGVSAAVIYGQYHNTAIAYIGDGGIVDAKEELTVDSSITLPFENKWADIDELKTNLENAFSSTTLGIEKAMFTSWAQSSSEAEKGAGSASVDIMNYRNISKAYIGKGALINQDTAFNNDQTKNDVSVTAKNDITTLNMAGMFKSPLEDMIKGARDKTKPLISAFGAVSEEGSGIGGAVLVTLEDNTTQAYIDTGSKVKAHDLTVEATTKVKNISLGEAGGKAENIGFNGTATVNLISDTTYAKIVNAGDMTASHDITAKALDDIYNIDVAGGITESNSVGIGVSIAYNDVQRDTQAGVSGKITAGNNLTVNAANTGGIVTVSLAGSVTKDEKTHLTAEGAVASSATPGPTTEDTGEYIKTLTSVDDDDDNAWQDYKQAARDAEADANSHNDQPTSNIDDDDSAWQDYKQAARDNEADANNPVDKIEEKIPEANTKDEHGHQAKAGVSIAGNVSINFVTEQALAFVGDNSAVPVNTIIAAKTSNIQAQNGSSIYAISGAAAVDTNKKSSSTGIAGAFMMNEITETTQAYTKNATMNVTGTGASDALSIQSINNSEILSIAASGSVAPHGNAIAGQVSLNMMNNGTSAYVDNSEIIINNDMVVAATDNSSITAVGGAVAYGGSAGVGASIAVNLMENTTEAYSNNSHVTGSNNDSDVVITATEESDIVSVTAAIGAGVGSNMAGAFSSSGNALTNTTKAYIAGSKGGNLAVDTRGSVGVRAEDKAQVTSIAGAGALDVSSGGVGIGASAAVLVTNNTVSAYIGDNTQISALGLDAGILVNNAPIAGLSIAATSNEAIVSIAAGGAGAGTAGIAGSASTNVLTQTTDAHIGKKANINSQDVTVTAANTTNVTGLAGALAVGLTAGIGAGADVEVITGTTTAYIDSGASVTANNNVIVAATSLEEVTSFAGSVGGGGTASVAGSASVHVMNTDTEAFIGRAGDTNKTHTAVNAGGSVALAAKDNSTLNLIAGSAAYGGTAGIDASVSTAVINKTTTATIGDYAIVTTQGNGNGVVTDLGTFDISYTDYSEDDIKVPVLSTNGYGDIDNQGVNQKRRAQASNTTMKGVAVTAVAQNTINTIAIGAGASGTLAVTGSAAVNVVNATTSAHIGKNVQIQSNSGAGHAQSVLVAAGSDYAQVGIAGALAGSLAAGVGAGATVAVVNHTTTADIDQKTLVTASGDVTVKAIASQDIISVAAALGASGEVGVAGGVTTNVLANHTAAYIGAQSSIRADNNVFVAATDTTEVVAVSGGVGIGLGVAGFGGSVAVTNIHKDTEAYIDDNATVDANARQTADTLSVYAGDQDSNGKRTMKNIRGISVAAQSSENITDVVASGGLGLYAGVAGSVAVNVDESTTSAYIGEQAKINMNNQNADAAQAVSIAAVNDVNMLSVSGAVGGGFVGVAGGVDVGIVKNATTAYVGYHAQVFAKNTVDVNALTTKNIDSYAASFSGGAVGVAGSVSVYAIGDNLDSDATDSLQATKDGDDNNNPKEDNVQQYVDGQMQTTRYTDMLSSYQDENIQQAGTTISQQPTTLSVSKDINNTTAVPGETTASVQGLIQSGGALSVGARGDLTFNTVVGAGSVGAAALGGAVSVVSVTNDVTAFISDDSPIQAKDIIVKGDLQEEFTGTIVAGGVGMGGSIAGAVAVTNDNSSSKAYIGNTDISSRNTLIVGAKASHNVNGTVVGASAALGGLALSGAVLTDNVSGSTQAYSIGNIGTAKNILVQAQTDTTLGGSVVAPSAGAFAGGAAVTTLTDTTKTEAFVSNQIHSDSGTLTVDGAATSVLTGHATGVGVGGIGVGVAVVDGTAQGQSRAYINDGSEVEATNVSIQAERTDRVIANTTAGSAGGAAVGGSVATASVNTISQAYTGSSVHINTPGKITIAATATPEAVAQADGYNFGALSVGVSVATGTVQSTVDAHLGSNNYVTSKDMTTIAKLLLPTTGNSVDTNATASGGGLIGVNATVSDADEQAVVTSYVGDDSRLTIDGDLYIIADANSKQQANSSADTGGIIAVGVNTSTATTDSTTKAYLGKDTVVNGGEGSTLAVIAYGMDETLAEATSGTGGVIAGSAATATTKSTSDTQAYIGGAKDATHINVNALGLAAQHTGTVNSHVDSLNASVAGGSGATATNTEDATVKVALNGNINTPKLVVKAVNNLLKPMRDNNGYNVEAGSGGLLNGAAAQEDTTFTGTTQISIGDGAAITVTGDKKNPNDTIFEALTNVDGYSAASLESGGAIEYAMAESHMTTTTNTGVDMGTGAHIDSVGDVTLAAYTTATTETNAEVNVWGLAGGAQGATKSTVKANNAVVVDENALIRVDGDINLYAGRSAEGATNVFNVNANTDLYNDTVIPMSGSPKADVSMKQTDTIGIAKGASLRSVGDVNLLAEAGTVDAVGYGNAKNLYDEALNAIFGSDVSYGTEYHSSSSPVAKTMVTVDGAVETGIQNKQYLLINAISEGDISQFNLDQKTGNGQGVFTVKTTSTEGITYTITKENLATNLLDYRKKLVDLKNQYAADQKVSQAYASDIAYVDSQLETMGLIVTDNNGVKVPIDSYAVYYLTVNDVKARGGNINVTADVLTGSGLLEAPKDSAITIINNSPLYLRTKQLLLADTDGRVNLNGVEVNSAQEITKRNQGNVTANLEVSLPRGASVVSATPTVNTITMGVANGVNSFNVNKSDGNLTTVTMNAVAKPTIDLQNNYTTALNSGKNLQSLFASAPNIQISDSITNSVGSVSIYNGEGSIILQGEDGNSPTIVANEVHINATNGSVYQSYTPGLTSIGGDPESLWTKAVSGLESTDNKNPSSTYSNNVSGQGGIYANGTVFISGEYLNINGTVQSGVAVWSLSLNGNQTYSGTGNLTLDGFISKKQTEWASSGKDPNAKYQISAGSAQTGTIASYYNPSTKQIELDGVTVQGGRVELYGQIMNTSGGNINALDGYGNINISNNTNYNLVVNTLNTGNNIHGVVKITDIGRAKTISGQDHYLITQYERNAAGQVQTTTSHTGLNDGVTTLSGARTRSVSGGYSPVTGTRYVWTLGQDKMTTTTDKYDHVVGGWGWDPFNWVTNNSDKVSSITVPDNLTALSNGTYATVDPSLSGTGLVRTYKNIVVSNLVNEDKSSYSNGFLDFNKHYITTRTTKTGSTDVYTYSAKADYPIAINFGGYDAGDNPSINISGPNTSTGNVIINNSLINQGGTVSISRPNSSILSSNTDAVIAAQNIILQSGRLNGIGIAAAPIRVQLLGNSGALRVHTEGGDINLKGVNGDLRISAVETGNGGHGKVTIDADGSIVQATPGDNAVIVGSGINLTSASGSIGTNSQPLNVSVNGNDDNTNSINAVAAKDISLRQPNGDFRLGHIESLSGDVTVEAVNGSLVDANPIDAVDTRTLDEMNALWDRMQVKQGTGANAANDQTLTAYANGKQTAYSDYWRMRHVTTNYDEQGNVTGYTSDAYNPSYTYTATNSDKAMFAQGGLTAVQQQQYIDGKTQTYLSVGAGIGSEAVYNPNYTYTITDTDRSNLTTKGWTDSQLKYSIDLSVAKQTVSTDTTLQDPNVTGKHVKLLAKKGGVGMDNGEIVIDPNDPDVLKDIYNADGTVTPSAARLALASAEGDDITIDKKNRIHVAQRQAIYVQADMVEAEGQKNVYIGSASPIYVKNIASGTGNNGIYEGTVRIKGKAGLYDVSTNGQGALQGGRTVIEAGYGGTLGTKETPFSIKLAEGAALTARAAGNIYIDSKGNNLYLAEIYSEGDVWLHAPGSILTNTNSSINSVATQGQTITLIADNSTLGAVDKDLLVNGDVIVASADSANITVTGNEGVVFDSLHVNNAVITAHVDNLSLKNTTIGTLASISNNSFTTIAGNNLDITRLSATSDVLLETPDQPFYLNMTGKKIDTDGMILGHATTVYRSGAATDNNVANVVSNAMNTHQKTTNTDRQMVLQANSFRTSNVKQEAGSSIGGIESTMQLTPMNGDTTMETFGTEDTGAEKQDEGVQQ